MSKTNIAFETLGETSGKTPVLWAHGWGQSRKAFLPLAQSFAQNRNILVDLPGFGDTPPPPENWGTAEYADALAVFIQEQTDKPVWWIGHSFGCRVGIQIAGRHPDLVRGLFLISAAGLQRKRPPHKKLYLKARIALYKFLKKMIPFGVSEDWLKTKFGSADYRNASTLRGVFVKVVNEDLSAQATQIRCPVMLVYGENDTETPPEMGTRLKNLIPGAELIVLPEQDHYTVLAQGRHQVAPLLKKFIGT